MFELATKNAKKELLTLPIYGAMVSYIEKCNDIDEIVEVHSQAGALELYAAQAMNTESERLARRFASERRLRQGNCSRSRKEQPRKRLDHVTPLDTIRTTRHL